MSFVVERLADLLIQKASSLGSVSKNVERLKSELIHMQGFLKAADAWPHRNDGELQSLVAEIRDLAHDAEDIIESRAFAAKKSTLRRVLNSWSVASEIDEFTSKINDLGGRLQRYGNGIIIREAGKQGSGTTQQNLLRPLRRTYTHIAEQHDVIGLEVDPKCFIHSPRCLNESQSWELFLSVAIRHREEAGFTFDENLEELGRRIVNRCGGLPLAIKTIGGNLQTKSSIDEWTMVYNNMVSHLSGIDNGLTELGIMSLLALSYHHLPYQLKQCFLHFSHFPEDFIISVDTITNIWVAEGIIPKGSGGYEVEDIAYAYLENLISRCMIQVEKQSSNGRIKSCRLHDLMRDLCIQEAKKEKFVHLENGHDDEATMQSTSIGKFRHLALYMKNSNKGPNLNYDIYDHVRSLLVFCNNMHPVFPNKSLLVAMTRPFKYLRLLYLDGDEIDLAIHEEIGYLVHLRLFDMGSICTKHLPSSLGKLTQLLTLKLDRLLNVDHMPNIFRKMNQLRHLYLPASTKFSLKNMKLNHLRNLQTLLNLPLKSVRIEDLAGLPSLRKLKLEVSDRVEFKRLVEMFNTSPNKTFNKLQSLLVTFGFWEREAIEITKVAATCPHLHKLKFRGPLVLDLPERLQIFCQLNKLKLYYSNFVEDPMPHLGKLPKLRVLLLDSTLKRDTIMCPKNSFPCLQSLVLSQEEHLNEWFIEEGALPLLSVLQLAFCDNLNTLPRGLEFVDSLRELQIDGMSKEFTKRIIDSHIVKNVRLRWNNHVI